MFLTDEPKARTLYYKTLPHQIDSSETQKRIIHKRQIFRRAEAVNLFIDFDLTFLQK